MNIAFLGDSITLGYALADKSKRYATLVCNQLQATELNFGITGTLIASAGISRSDHNSFLERMHLIDSADFAIVFGGTNDYFWSDRPIEFPQNPTNAMLTSGNTLNPDEYFRPAVQKLMDHCLATRPPNSTLFVTPYQHHGIGNFLSGQHFKDKSEHDTSAPNFNNQTLKDYADVLIQEATQRNLPVLNLFDSDFDWQSLTSDGCHPNPAGHAWLADKIIPEIQLLL